MSDISKLDKVALFFPHTMKANGFVYAGGETYNIHKTAGTIERWVKRGCSLGDPKEAKPDPRLPKVEDKKADKPKQSRGRKRNNVVETSDETVENREE